MVELKRMDKLGSEFLKEKYNNPPLHTSKEVSSASRNLRSSDPNVRIQKYLDRLENIIGDSDNAQRKIKIDDNNRPRSVSLLREMVMDTYVRPQKEKLATSAAAVEERAARQLGMDIQYGERELAERGNIAVKDLENSLDQWILYLSDKNEPYPTWFRYYTFRNVLTLGRYDKDKNEFPKRSVGTNLLFPDIDRGALGYMEDLLEAAKDDKALERFREVQLKTGTPSDQMLTKEKAVSFSKLSFAKQYSESINQKGEITPEMRAETEGKWIKYSKGSDPTGLWKSLQNKGVPWCTAGFGTAQNQLEGGDFYVYYTLDKQGKPTIPRIAIRMQGDTVFEARGVADNAQNIESNMSNIAEEQLNKLPGAEKYKKASSDMKLLTDIEAKVKKGEALGQNELIFLYEINSKIEGFGYQKDPRIDELRKTRNSKEDAPIVLGCNPEQIAWGTNDVINEKTKAYIGPLYSGIFKLLPDSVQIFTSFPERKINRDDTLLENKNAQKQEKELKKMNIWTSSYFQSMLQSKDFEKKRFKERTPIKVQAIRLTCGDLMRESDSKGYLTTEEVQQRAKELGLLDTPTAPDMIINYALQNGDKISKGDWFYSIGMEPIADSDGSPNVFELDHGEDGLELRDRWTEPDDEWYSEDGFVFCLRK